MFLCNNCLIFFRQYVKNKPTRWGIKLFVVCDSKTGYTYCFEVYLGSTADDEVTSGTVTYKIVMRLLDSLLDQGYIVYMDNLYTSVPLMKTLTERSTMACGTIRPFRSNFTKLDKAQHEERRKRAEEEDRAVEHGPAWSSTVNRGN